MLPNNLLEWHYEKINLPNKQNIVLHADGHSNLEFKKYQCEPPF